MELEAVRARILAALKVVPFEDWPEDWWVEEAVRVIEAHRALAAYQRVYDVSTVGARVRTAREIVGLTQRMLGDRLDVKQRDISDWERGRRDMPAEVLPRLALCLGVAVRWLLDGGDEGGPPAPTGILRKQKLVNWAKRSWDTLRRHRARAELERLRGLRPPIRRPTKTAPQCPGSGEPGNPGT